MANNNDEKINLIIDAKNLSSDELNKAAQDIEGLGGHARKTEKALKNLKIDSATLDSYEKMKAEMKDLQTSLRNAELDYEDMNAALKKNKKATREQREEVKKAKQQLDAQKKELTAVGAAYNKLTKSVHNIKNASETSAEAQERLSNEMRETSAEVTRLNKVLENKVKVLNKNITAEKKSIASSKEKEKAEKETAKAAEKAAKSAKEQAHAEALVINKNRDVVIGLKKYERQLDLLNKAKSEGTISTGKYVRQEEKLRKQYKLTSAQAKSTRLAIEADNKASANKRKSTDLLTQGTRRLAQAYTVLLAAQKATEAVGAGVQSYGKLEAAITSVEKTTGLAREQVVAMQEELTEMATNITPTATNELLRYAEVAGQLGAKSSEDILQLVSAADALEVSTNLAGDEAVKLLTRVLTLTGEGIPSIHNLSSSVVELGNNFAASEDEIVHMTKEIASGTREIDLGSAAAAAYGTTLKELGQPAERSRTAIQRVGQAIKSASSKGGDDLERLMKITGQTADTIERDLGERPEEVLFSFLEGLDNIKQSGGSVSETLGEMGIASQEANAVIGVLSANTERLRYAIDLSNNAYQDQTKHLAEAAKAYANQESAVSRLVNQFESLKAAAGEAISDEVNTTLENMNKLLNDNSGLVSGAVEAVTEVGEAIGEVISISSAIGDIVGTFDVLNIAGNTVKLTFNTITIVIRNMLLALNEAKVSIADFFGASEEQLNKLRETSRKLKEDILTDQEDMQRGFARMAGESSGAYEDLQDAAKKYSSAVSELSDEQQKEIEQLLAIGQYSDDNAEKYNKATAAIVRQSREITIRNELAEQAAERSAKAAEKAAQEREKQIVKAIGSQEALNKVLAQTSATEEELVERRTLVNEAYSRGKLSLDEYIDAMTGITDNQTRLNQVTDDAIALQREKIKTNRDDSRSVTDLRLSLLEQETALRKLNIALDSATSVGEERNKQLLQQKKLEEDITQTSEQLALTKQYEAQTVFQLAEAQRQHNLVLDDLKFKRDAGIITAGQYAAQVQDLAFKTQLLTQLIGSESDGMGNLSDNTNKAADAIRRLKNEQQGLGDNTEEQNELTEQQNELLQKNAGHAGVSIALTNRWLGLQEEFNKGFDGTNLSIAELKEELKGVNIELSEFNLATAKATHDLIGVMKPIDDMQRAVHENKIAIIEQTIAVNEMVEGFEDGSVSLEDFIRYAENADFSLKKLSENQLEPLRAALRRAKAEFQDLQDTINDALDDVDDRLDELLGRESDILKRKFAREMAELTDLLSQAQASGDAALIDKINEAIRKLRQAQKIELKEAQGDGSTNRNTQTSDSSDKSTRQVYTVKLELSGGSTKSINVSSKADADALISAISQLGEINIDGVN